MLYALYVVLLAAFLCGYVARYVHPEWFWWFQLVAVFLPFLAGALVVATVFVVLSHRRGLLAMHAVVLVLIGIRFLSFGGAAEGNGDGLRLATYNLGQLDAYRGSERPAALVRIVDEMEADLYGFQELITRYRRREQRIWNYEGLAESLDSSGIATVAAVHENLETTFLPVWGRRGRVTLDEMARIKLTSEDSLSMGLTRVLFTWRGRQAVLYNIHLRTFGERKPWSDPERRLFSVAFWRFYLGQYRTAFVLRAHETVVIRDMLARETLPVIVSGDFNSTVHNWSYHQLARSMRDAYRTAGPAWGATYHARLPVARIDHVLVSPDWEVHDARIEPAAYSDHLPLRVVLDWRE